MIPSVSTSNHVLLLIEPFWQVLGAITLSILPAWGLASRLSLDPLTRLLVAGLSSYTLMYLLELLAYLVSAPQWVPVLGCLLASLVSAIQAVQKSRDTADSGPFPWEGVLAWVALAVWILGMQSRVVVYGGAGWFGDWYEHYERAAFFLDRLPPSTKFLEGLWSLPARGPMFNTSAALLMVVFGREFWVYQAIATVLNTFPVLALALLIRDMGGIRYPTALLWGAALLAIAPFAVQHEIFSWTKSFTLGFILGGIHLYRLGLIHERAWLVGASFGAFAAGILAHYLVIPFVLFFACHLLYSVVRRRWGWRVVLFPALGCLALLATWFGYLVLAFGLQATLGANSTFGDYAKQMAGPGRGAGPWKEVFVGNMITTIVPYGWRHDFRGMGRAPRIVQSDYRAGEKFQPAPIELNRKTEWFEDLARNPSSLPGALGWAGGAGVLISVALAIRKRRDHGLEKDQQPGPGWIFWLMFFVLGIPLNVLMSRDYQGNGVAHLNLHPFVFLTAVLVMRWLRDAPMVLRILLPGLFLVESALTTGALLALQGRQVPLFIESETKVAVFGKLDADSMYVNNYIYKLRQKAVFLSDRLGNLRDPFSLISAMMPIGLLIGGLIRITSGGTAPEPRLSTPKQKTLKASPRIG